MVVPVPVVHVARIRIRIPWRRYPFERISILGFSSRSALVGRQGPAGPDEGMTGSPLSYHFFLPTFSFYGDRAHMTGN
jgi:hypothetical protein